MVNIYELNTRTWLKELSYKYQRHISLAVIPDEEILCFKEWGFDAIWLMGVWQSGPKAQEAARHDARLMNELRALVNGLKPEEVSGSPYAIANYTVDSSLGTNQDIKKLKERLNTHGIKLLLDFVPNHVGLDHAWLKENPDYFIQGSSEDLKNSPDLFFQLADTKNIFTHGKDPYFLPWQDTAQLNYYNPSTRKVMTEVLEYMSSFCDGVRCDMAMLILKRVQREVWKERVLGIGKFKEPQAEFWQGAIAQIKKMHPEFIFLAEVYWGLEQELIELGFDYVYDKSFYDFLKESYVERLKEYMTEPQETACKKLKFIENHDENRSISIFASPKYKAAAFLLAISPGAHLYYQGQLEGFRRKQPLHLIMPLVEEIDTSARAFYTHLLGTLKDFSLDDTAWDSAVIFPAWKENETYKNFIGLFNKIRDTHYLAVVNYSDVQSQCFTYFDITSLQADELIFKDSVSQSEYVRAKEEIIIRGFYLDMPKYSFHLFKIAEKK